MDFSYNPRLEALLGGNTDSSVMLNREFSTWREYIEDDFRMRNGDNHDTDKNGLNAACQNHITKHSRRINSREVVLIVHPFYASTVHRHLIDDDTKAMKVDAYNKNMMHLMTAANARGMGVILIDSPGLYAATTSLLMEQGKASTAVLSLYDQGHPLKRTELEAMKGTDKVYVAGSYNGRCVGNAVEHVTEIAGPGKVVGIRDLLLSSPYDRAGAMTFSQWESDRLDTARSTTLREMGIINEHIQISQTEAQDDKPTTRKRILQRFRGMARAAAGLQD